VLVASIKRARYGAQIEVEAAQPDGVGELEVTTNIRGTAATDRETGALDTQEQALVAAWRAAVGDVAPVGFGTAMANALAARPGQVNEVEIGMRAGTPIYEVKIVGAGRERSVKVHALTGAIIP
jgi:uncharacterized membrane protein YkoI